MKKWLKKITGIERLEKEREAALASLAEAKAREEEAVKAEELAKLNPKERATLKQEPWVAVLDTHVNKDNVRNGFFELDWNEYFIVQLKQAGYGLEGDPDEEIVDRWFRDLAGNMLAEAGVANPNRTIGGYININSLGNGKAEIE